MFAIQLLRGLIAQDVLGFVLPAAATGVLLLFLAMWRSFPGVRGLIYGAVLTAVSLYNWFSWRKHVRELEQLQVAYLNLGEDSTLIMTSKYTHQSTAPARYAVMAILGLCAAILGGLLASLLLKTSSV